MKYLSKIILLMNLSFFGFFTSHAQDQLPLVNSKDGLALSGYDPVTYFTESAPLKGSSQFVYNYKGFKYQFATNENLQLFKKEPAKYEPQYGGWCAFAMGDYAKKVEVDPLTYKITDGKLYLFYNFYFNNTLKTWNKNETVLKNNADKNWKVYEESAKK